jgi:hypothetical protein
MHNTVQVCGILTRAKETRMYHTIRVYKILMSFADPDPGADVF